jgi:predicted lipoprotein with Yx(FWY)xxD motif
MNRTLCFALIAVVTMAAHANPTQIANGMMTSKDGKTLYVFDKDTAGRSNCNGGCAVNWPPFAVANPAFAGGDFSVVQRDDGSSQWAFKGMPLYFFAGDAKAGDANGDKQGGVWHVIRTESNAKKSASYDSGHSGYSY